MVRRREVCNRKVSYSLAQTQVRFLPRPLINSKYQAWTRRVQRYRVAMLTVKILLILKQEQMANMSYCRFENTVRDMRDCINAIEDGECDSLSSYEINALKEFKRMGDEIKSLDIDIDLILEEYDS